MAISMNRLQELIKERARVYIPDKHWGVGTIKLQEEDYIRGDRLNGSGIIYENISGTNIGYSMPLKDIFENKEDAEFAIKYQNITRTETLSLPTWEEIYETANKEFYNLRDNMYFEIIGRRYPSYDERTIRLVKCYTKILFEKPLTKENYLKACELCRKLFLGEEE